MMAIAIAWWTGKGDALEWIGFGIATSAVTSLMSWVTIERTVLKQEPLGRLLAETSVRLAIPLAVLMAVAVARRELLTPENIACFLPFQFVTLVAGVNRSVVESKRVRSKSLHSD